MSKHSVKDREFGRIVTEEKARCKAAKGTCWICHKVINCDLPYTDKKSFTLDHVKPASTPGIDKKRRANLKWAHRDCNSRRGDGTSARTLITSRKW